MEGINLPHDHGTISERLHHDTSTEHSARLISEVFKLLADAGRTELFWMLCHCEECTANLSALLGMKSSLVSHHLKKLKGAGLAVSRREGKEVYYTAADTEKTKLLHEAIERIAELECPSESMQEQTQSRDANVYVITKLHDMMTGDLKRHYTVDELAAIASMNKTTLKLAFKAYYGRPIAAYMREYRIKCARRMLEQTDKTLAQISSDVGYENPSKFTAAFKHTVGVLPSKYRRCSIYYIEKQKLTENV